MKTIFHLLLLVSFTGFSQASAIINFDITFSIPADNLKNTDFYILTYASGVYPEVCNYTVESQAESKTKINLLGSYDYIIGPKDFLGTICISVKSVTPNGVEKTQNYFIDIDKQISIKDKFTLNLGDIKLDDNHPFITVHSTNNNLSVSYDNSTDHTDGLLSRLTKWSKFQKIKNRKSK